MIFTKSGVMKKNGEEGGKLNLLPPELLKSPPKKKWIKWKN